MRRITVSDYINVAEIYKSVYVDADLSDESDKGLVFVDGTLPQYQTYRILAIAPKIKVEYNIATPYTEVWIMK